MQHFVSASAVQFSVMWLLHCHFSEPSWFQGEIASNHDRAGPISWTREWRW